MSNSLTDIGRIDKLLRSINTDDIASARESVVPLMTGERMKDTAWLCALCYLLGKADVEERAERNIRISCE